MIGLLATSGPKVAVSRAVIGGGALTCLMCIFSCHTSIPPGASVGIGSECSMAIAGCGSKHWNRFSFMKCDPLS